jgi:ATP-dependent protease ClpP protease subunit
MYNNKLIKKKSIENKEVKKIINDEDDHYYTPSNISVINNHIYFYSPVTTESILELNKHIQTLNYDLNKTKLDIDNRFNIEINPTIYLHINSLGGYVFDALAAVDTIKNSKIPITSIIEGCAASAATLISIVAQKRKITKNSSILIHQLSGGTWGTFEQMKDDNLNNIYLHEKMKELYLNHTNGRLKEKKLKKVLKRDIWWNPQKCKKLGLIDEII